MWWGPLTNQKPPRVIDQSQLLCALEGVQRTCGGSTEGCGGVRRGHGGGTEGVWREHGGMCRGCTGAQGHGGGMEGAQRGAEGHKGGMEGCRGLCVLGYYWLSLATIDLVGDSREPGCLRHILRYYIVYM